MSPGALPCKFSQYDSSGATPGGPGRARGDVVPVLEWIDVPSVEQPIPLANLSLRLAQLLEKWESHMLLDSRSLLRGRMH